jgi:hypothetical protein
VLSNEGCEFGKGLFSRTSYTDEKGVSGGRVNDSCHSQQVEESIIENNQVHLLGWECLVELTESLVDALLD